MFTTVVLEVKKLDKKVSRERSFKLGARGPVQTFLDDFRSLLRSYNGGLMLKASE